MADTVPKILLVERGLELRDLITFFFESTYGIVPMDCNSAFEATSELQQDQYSLVICNYDLEIEETPVYNYLKSKGAKSSYLLISDVGLDQLTEYEGKEVTAVIPKDSLLESIESICSNLFEKKEGATTELGYCKITMRCLMHLDQIDEDCYIQLKSGRFLKLFSKGDNVTQEDVARYNKKGVDYLYLKKEVTQWVVKTFNEKMPTIIKKIEENESYLNYSKTAKKVSNDNLPTISPMAQMAMEIEDEVKEILNVKLKKTMDVLKKRPHLAKLLKELNVNRDNDNYINAHNGLLCNLTSGISKLMGWSTDATIEKFVFVALLHDILLAKQPKLARLQSKKDVTKTPGEYSEEEQKLFFNHPLATAEMIRQMSSSYDDIPQGVDVIIEQHHERPDGSGFPRGLVANRIPPLSALFIVCHDLSTYIIENPDWNIKTYINKVKDEFRGSNFTKVIAALNKM